MFQPLMTDQDAAKLMNHPNPHQTGAMHGFLLAHVGMRFRLLDTIDKKRGLIEDAEGTLVHVAHNPADGELVAAAWAHRTAAPRVYLRHFPLGLWLLMDELGPALSPGSSLIIIEVLLLLATGYVVALARVDGPDATAAIITLSFGKAPAPQ